MREHTHKYLGESSAGRENKEQRSLNGRKPGGSKEAKAAGVEQSGGKGIGDEPREVMGYKSDQTGHFRSLL